MLMKEKAVFVFGVTMILLALGLLLAGCGEENPEGTGNVSILLSLPGASADGKTGAVMPDLATILSTVKVDCVYEGGLFSVYEEFDTSTNPMTVSLPQGYYTFTVTGYDENGTAIATATKPKAVSTEDKTVSVFIGPIPNVVNESEQPVPGSFHWNITLPDGDDENFTFTKIKLISFAPLALSETKTKTIENGGNHASGSFQDLKSGSYEVEVEMTDPARSYATVVRIYAGAATEMTLGADCFIPKIHENISINLKEFRAKQC
jgi:hypothetical protein